MADWILELMESAGYVGLLFLMLLENIFPPIPSELVMPLAGYKTGIGEMTMLGVVVAGTLGSLVGAWVFYGIGRSYGRARLYKLAENHGRWIGINADDIDHAQSWFDKHGSATVFFCRLIPGVRSLISIPAGLAEQNIFKFTIYTAAGSALWCCLLAWVGLELGENYTQVGKYLNPVSWTIFALLFGWYIRRIWKAR
ncbi:MAG: DedA family protein [Pseudomonadaceae bacterium]|nr:DedA family protein [Pseudomonadaceae bacterium]